MQEYGKRLCCLFDAEQVLEQHQMPGTADRQELRQPLYKTQYD